MSNTAFDTLAVARRLEAAGVEAKQADAIAGAMDEFTGQFVTVKHFDAAVGKLNTRIDAVRTELQASIDTTRAELQAGIDTTRAELQAGIDTTRADLRASFHAGQAEMTRFLVIVAGVIIAANALMFGILRFFPRDGAVM